MWKEKSPTVVSCRLTISKVLSRVYKPTGTVDVLQYSILFLDPPSSFKLPLRYQAEFEFDEKAYKKQLKKLSRGEQEAEESKRKQFEEAQEKARFLIREGIAREQNDEMGHREGLKDPNTDLVTMVVRPAGSYYPSYKMPRLWEEVHARVLFHWYKGVQMDGTGEPILTTGTLFKAQVWLMTARETERGLGAVQTEKVRYESWIFSNELSTRPLLSDKFMCLRISPNIILQLNSKPADAPTPFSMRARFLLSMGLETKYTKAVFFLESTKLTSYTFSSSTLSDPVYRETNPMLPEADRQQVQICAEGLIEELKKFAIDMQTVHLQGLQRGRWTRLLVKVVKELLQIIDMIVNGYSNAPDSRKGELLVYLECRLSELSMTKMKCEKLVTLLGERHGVVAFVMKAFDIRAVKKLYEEVKMSRNDIELGLLLLRTCWPEFARQSQATAGSNDEGLHPPASASDIASSTPTVYTATPTQINAVVHNSTVNQRLHQSRESTEAGMHSTAAIASSSSSTPSIYTVTPTHSATVVRNPEFNAVGGDMYSSSVNDRSQREGVFFENTVIHNLQVTHYHRGFETNHNGTGGRMPDT
ncbi:hypothetical protein FB446DRAFT_809492 [Lentinula raphanica]|nr:hypothetical protein FB446DRAFT_809492 [Lentinula raphanica]